MRAIDRWTIDAAILEHRGWVERMPYKRKALDSAAFASELVRSGLCRRHLADKPCDLHRIARCLVCYRSGELALEFR